ncbi:YciI family protein [Microcella alkalica]|nr:YciI family protein [Microcella alkalica]
MISVIDDTSGSASADETEAIDAFNDELKADGHWVVAGGISSPEDAVVVDARGEEPIVRPGPLHDTEDYVAGFWLIEASDRETALELATRGSRACNRRVELRPLLGLAR